MMVVFLGYYSPENYQLLLQTADDRKKLDDKWEDWLLNFLKVKTSMSREFIVEEVHVDVRNMNDNFKTKKIKNTSSNRAVYIQEAGAAELEKRKRN